MSLFSSPFSFNVGFPDPEKVCFRVLIPLLQPYVPISRFDLSHVFPRVGPITALSLGACLTYLWNEFGFCTVRLPKPKVCHVTGTIHISECVDCVSVHEFIVCLLKHHTFLVGMDPQQVINNAMSVGAASIGASEATKLFRDQLDSMVNVTVQLTEKQQKLLLVERPMLRFSSTTPFCGDHALLAAARQVIRADFDSLYDIRKDEFPTLILGASARELGMYNCLQHVSFQFKLNEGKDMTRFVIDMLSQLACRRGGVLKKKKKKLDNDLCYTSFRDAVDMWKETSTFPDRYLFFEEADSIQQVCRRSDGVDKFVGRRYTTLVAQDVGYNFTENDWCSLFASTGALVCYGYMMLPYELIFDTVADQAFYKAKKNGDDLMVGHHGTQNGYVHSIKAWGTLLAKPVLRGEGVQLAVEICSSVGPMRTFKILRTNSAEKIVRCLLLPSHLQTVSILDLDSSFDFDKKKIGSRVYFNVCREYFEMTVNYCLDLSKESLKFENVLLYVRKRCMGMSLVSKVCENSWNIPMHRVRVFSLVCYLYSALLSSRYVDVMSAELDLKFWDRFKKFLSTFLCPILWPINKILNFFKSENAFDILVLGGDVEIWQQDKIVESTLGKILSGVVTIGDHLVGKELSLVCVDKYRDEKVVDIVSNTECLTCALFRDIVPDQVVECNNVATGFHNFSLTSDEIKELKNKLSDVENDPVGLREIKTQALKHVPGSAFSYRCRVNYLCGPPGTGKSYTVRAMAGRDALVVAPFNKLKAEYVSFELNGVKKSLPFYTQHTALSCMNSRVVYVDEFTAFPYELLAIILMNVGAEEVWFVGDHKQTGIRAGLEGIPIVDKIDLTKVPTHRLRKNFRNPKDAVCALNQLFSYDMIGVKEDLGFDFGDLIDFGKYSDFTPMCFSSMTASAMGLDSNLVSVRACQGSTFDKVVLCVTEADRNIISIDAMKIVALSRHRSRCVILGDGSPVADVFIGLIKGCDLTAVNLSDCIWRLDNHPTLPPDTNDCLLVAFSEMSGFPKETIWDKYVSVVGKTRAAEVRNMPMSTLDLDYICSVFGVRVVVMVSETNKNFVCGKSGSFIGTMLLETGGIGHFSSYQRGTTSNNPLLDTGIGRFSRAAVDTCVVPGNFGEPVSVVREVSWLRETVNCGCHFKYNICNRGFDGKLISVVEPVTVYAKPGVYRGRTEGWIPLLDTIVADCGYPGVFDCCKIFKFSGLLRDFGDLVGPINNPLLIVCLSGGCKGLVVCKNTYELNLKIGDFFRVPFLFRNNHTVMFQGGKDVKLLVFLCSRVLTSLGPVDNLIGLGALSGDGILSGNFSRHVGEYSGGAKGVQVVSPFVCREVFPKFSPGFDEYISRVIDRVSNERVLSCESTVVENVIVRHEKSEYDAFLWLKEEFSCEFEKDLLVTNQCTLNFVCNSFDNGKIDLTVFDNVNQRFNVSRPVEKYRTFLCNSPGNYYFKNSLGQSLRCLQARYLTRVYSTAFSVEGEKLAWEIADAFVVDHMDVGKVWFSEDEYNEIIYQSEASMERKKYERQVNPDIYQLRGVNFSMKDIFKPFKTKVDLWKAGQGISAWTKDQQSLFQHLFRVLNLCFVKSLKDHVVFDNFMTEVEVVAAVQRVFSYTPTTAVNGVIDATACDSGQNKFTQTIERFILLRFGVPTNILDLYYSMRESYTMYGYGVKAFVTDIKTSGEPATLLNNTILMAALLNYLLVGEGPKALVIKGDDGLLRQANLRYREGALGRLSKQCKLEFKVDINVPITFCGYILCGDKLLHDVLRKVFKVLGHHYKSYEHFCDYQQSLRDWLLSVNTVGLNDVLELTALAYEKDVEIVRGWLNGIESITHLNREQFMTNTQCVNLDIETESEFWDCPQEKYKPSWPVSDLIKH